MAKNIYILLFSLLSSREGFTAQKAKVSQAEKSENKGFT